MLTSDEKRAFFESHREALEEAAESGGVAGALSFIEGFDEEHRGVLHLHVRELAGFGFDFLIRLSDSGISEFRRLADRAEDEDERERLLAEAHTVSFNLSADLADCWAGDDRPRNTGHLRRGLRAALDCIAWCPPESVGLLARDYWAKGVHQIALDDMEGAIESWEESLTLARRHAGERGLPTEVSPEGYYGVLLASGLMGMAKTLQGDRTGMSLYLEAITALGVQLGEKKTGVAASIAIGQIEKIRGRFTDWMENPEEE